MGVRKAFRMWLTGPHEHGCDEYVIVRRGRMEQHFQLSDGMDVFLLDFPSYSNADVHCSLAKLNKIRLALTELEDGLNAAATED